MDHATLPTESLISRDRIQMHTLYVQYEAARQYHWTDLQLANSHTLRLWPIVS